VRTVLLSKLYHISYLHICHRGSCKIFLAPIAQAKNPIPISFIHPHWLIDGPAIVLASWAIPLSITPSVENNSIPNEAVDSVLLQLHDNAGHTLFMRTAFELETFQKALSAEESEEFSQQFQQQSAQTALSTR
jgi:hypothetical protein